MGNIANIKIIKNQSWKCDFNVLQFSLVAPWLMKVIFDRQAHLVRCVSGSYNKRITNTSPPIQEDGEWYLIWVQQHDSFVWNLVLFQYFVVFCCNFMFCLIVQSGRCDFHVSFYPSVFRYQKGIQKVLGLLWGMAWSILPARTTQTTKGVGLSSRRAQKAHFLPSVLPPASPCSLHSTQEFFGHE